MSFYNFALKVVKGFTHMFFRIKVVGLENIPKDENFIVCANHKSNFDPILIGTSLPVEFNFMAKQELFKSKIFGGLLRSLKTFPVNRGKGDIGAIRSAVNVLKNGGNLVIFPEGRRSMGNCMSQGKGGAVLIALKSRVNILPVGIEGSYKPFAKIVVNIGKPIDLSKYFGEKVDSDIIKNIVDGELMPTISLLSKVPMGNACLAEGTVE